MSVKPVAKYLSAKNNGLHNMLERAQYLQMLTRVLRETLNPELADHVSLANVHDDTAVVTTDTPAWLTQLRYQAPIILQHLKQQPGLEGLRKIQFKIQPPSQAPILQPARRAQLSTYSANVLESAANCTEDSELSDALRRLSKQTSKDA
jgi:hypothetical protein